MKNFLKKIEYLENKYIEYLKSKDKENLRREEEILKLKGSKSLSLPQFQKIVKWKNPRDRSSAKNSERDIQKITKSCFEELKNNEYNDDKVRSAIEKLKKLNGVGVAVASAILMAYDPCKFTPIDWRAWNMLYLLCYIDEPCPKSFTPDHYIKYLKVCRKLAKELDVYLRTLDRALWIASKNYRNLDC
ncbi:MAG TPA: hypothetical protein PLF90_00455 [bacterium]|nr:hypothetical protein [bacterium]